MTAGGWSTSTHTTSTKPSSKKINTVSRPSKAIFYTPANQPSGFSAALIPDQRLQMSKRELSQEGEVADVGPAKKKAKTNLAEGTTSNQVRYRIIIIG